MNELEVNKCCDYLDTTLILIDRFRVNELGVNECCDYLDTTLILIDRFRVNELGVNECCDFLDTTLIFAHGRDESALMASAWSGGITMERFST